MEKLAPKSVFITGCSRGIGLEFVKQFCRLPNAPKHVFATCRNPDKSKDLQTIAENNPSIHVIKLDVTDYKSFPNIVDQVKRHVGDNGLNILLNNAGLLHRDKLGEVMPENMRETYEINCVAPLMLAQAFLPLLRQAAANLSDLPMGCSRAAIVNMSTKVASVADNSSGGVYPYRCSKIALNMVNKSEVVDLLPDKIAAYLLHPGWVLTDMGGQNALIDVETSVNGMLKVMAGLDEEKNGTFYDYKGELIPW